MEQDQRSITGPKLFYAVVVMIFGWGTFWMGHNGIEIAKNMISDEYGAVTLTAATYDNSTNKSATLSVTNTPSIASKVPSSPSASIASSSLTILIGGDIMMDRTMRKLGQKSGYDTLFDAITPLFKKADIVVANLEGPITSNPSKTLLPNGNTTKELTFTFEPVTAKALNNSGIDFVSLANNHTDNFGLSGLAETKKWLTASDIKWFGDPRNASSTEAVITKNNIDVAFVGYHAFQKGFDRVISSVKDLSSKGYFVIVLPHWGTEYSSSSSAQMKTQARTLVASGASAIFGSHPHVVLEHSSMGDVPVFYSLGNLVFDQYFSAAVMKGNVVEMQLSKKNDKVTIDEIRIYETSIAGRQGVTVNMTPMDF